MPGEIDKHIIATCACGSVEFVAAGAPIVCAACYCEDCQEGARQIESLPNALPFTDSDGGTPMLVYRKDRVTCTKGTALLRAHKLIPDSPTNRVVATCCNSAMILRFDDAKWWTDIYRARIQGESPPLEMRTCTKFRRAKSVPSDGVPEYSHYPSKLLAKLLVARVTMLLHR